MEYKLSGKVSLKDFIQFNKNYKKHGTALITRITVYSALIVFIGFVLLSTYKFFRHYIFNLPASKLLIVFSPFIILIIFIILLITVGMPMIYKKNYNANKGLQQSFNITINEQCILITTETGYEKITKEFINKIYYDKDSIYIYSGPNIAHIIKKRYMENQDDFESLVKFVKEYYGNP